MMTTKRVQHQEQLSNRTSGICNRSTAGSRGSVRLISCRKYIHDRNIFVVDSSVGESCDRRIACDCDVMSYEL